MKLRNGIILTLVVLLAGVAGLYLFAQSAAPKDAQMIVTVAPKHDGTPPPEIHPEDLMVYQDHQRVKVTSVTPLAAAPNVNRQLFLLIDDSLGTDLGTQMPELKQFITGLPQNVAVGIAYMQNGGYAVAQQPTTDHNAAAKALRLPTAMGIGSPFESVEALLKQWPKGSGPGQIVMLSDGIEPWGTNTSDNPYVDKAISMAQQAHVPVYAIYLPARGHFGRNSWRAQWGLTYMSRIGDETGGEGYATSGIQSVSIGNYLDDVSKHIRNQYLVAFTPNPVQKPGFVPVKVNMELRGVDVTAPDRVWIGSQPGM